MALHSHWQQVDLLCLGRGEGTGQGAIEAIVAERKANGPFKSFFDFCSRVDRKRVNKRVVEALIKAGAFDTMVENRAALLASVSLAFEYADTLAANADQGGLFDFGDSHAASTNEARSGAHRAVDAEEKLSLGRPPLASS